MTELVKTPQGYKFGSIIVEQSDVTKLFATIQQTDPAKLIATIQQLDVTKLFATIQQTDPAKLKVTTISEDPLIDDQIWVYDTVSGNAIQLLYTIPADKKLFISSSFFAVRNEATQNSASELYIRDASDTFWKMLQTIPYTNVGSWVQANQYMPFLIVPANYDICIRNTVANTRCYGIVTAIRKNA